MRKILLFAFFSCGIGCGTLERQTVDSFNIYPLEFEVIARIDNMVEQIKVVKLETTAESTLDHINKILINDRHDYIVYSSSIMQFDSTGKYIRQIGMPGRGPHEYISIADIAIDGNGLLVLDDLGRVLFYSTIDGSFVKSVDLKWENNHSRPSDGIIPSNNNGFYIFSANANDINDFSEKTFCLFRFDSVGTQLSAHIERKDWIFDMNTIAQACGNEYVIRALDGDDLCHKVMRDSVVPLCRIDFQDKKVPLHSMFADGELDIRTYLASAYFKTPINLQQGENHLLFTACGENFESHTFIYSNMSNCGVRYKINEQAADFYPFTFTVADCNYMYGVYWLHDDSQVECLDPLNKLVHGRVGVVADGQNPYIVGVKFNF